MEPLRYGLDERPKGVKFWLYTLQFLAFNVANSAVIPVIVGAALGLGHSEIASLVQRTFFFCALGSLLQVTLGHRYPIFEGPAGMWYTVFIVLASTAEAMGKPLPVLRTDLEFGLLAAGVVTVSLGASGLMRRVVFLFTPIVNGVFLTVMGLQLSPSIVKGLLGIVGEGAVSGRALVVATVTVLTAMAVTLHGREFLASISILVATLVGWGTALLVGLTPLAGWESGRTLSLPQGLAWGRPTFDAGITLTCVLAGLVVLSNLVASLMGMAELTHTVADSRRMNRGALFTGVSDLLGGFGAVVGFIPYASSLGLVSVSRVSSRLPFAMSAVVLALLALFPLVGHVFAALPPAVGYSILLVTFSQVVIMGIRNLARTGLDSRASLIVGVTLMVGVGIMSVPLRYLEVLPAWARYLASNGVIVATALSMLLDNVVAPRTTVVPAAVPGEGQLAKQATS
jgi:xanthine/uracil permease